MMGREPSPIVRTHHRTPILQHPLPRTTIRDHVSRSERLLLGNLTVAGLGSLTERSHLGHQTRGGLGKPINHQLSTINGLHHLAAQFGSRSSHPYGKDSISSLLLLKMV